MDLRISYSIVENARNFAEGTTRSKVLYVNIPRTTFFARLTHFCLRNVFEICGSIKLERALEAKDQSEIRFERDEEIFEFKIRNNLLLQLSRKIVRIGKLR